MLRSTRSMSSAATPAAASMRPRVPGADTKQWCERQVIYQGATGQQHSKQHLSRMLSSGRTFSWPSATAATPTSPTMATPPAYSLGYADAAGAVASHDSPGMPPRFSSFRAYNACKGPPQGAAVNEMRLACTQNLSSAGAAADQVLGDMDMDGHVPAGNSRPWGEASVAIEAGTCEAVDLAGPLATGMRTLPEYSKYTHHDQLQVHQTQTQVPQHHDGWQAMAMRSRAMVHQDHSHHDGHYGHGYHDHGYHDHAGQADRDDFDVGGHSPGPGSLTRQLRAAELTEQPTASQAAGGAGGAAAAPHLLPDLHVPKGTRGLSGLGDPLQASAQQRSSWPSRQQLQPAGSSCAGDPSNPQRLVAEAAVEASAPPCAPLPPDAALSALCLDADYANEDFACFLTPGSNGDHLPGAPDQQIQDPAGGIQLDPYEDFLSIFDCDWVGANREDNRPGPVCSPTVEAVGSNDCQPALPAGMPASADSMVRGQQCSSNWQQEQQQQQQPYGHPAYQRASGGDGSQLQGHSDWEQLAKAMAANAMVAQPAAESSRGPRLSRLGSMHDRQALPRSAGQRQGSAELHVPAGYPAVPAGVAAVCAQTESSLPPPLQQLVWGQQLDTRSRRMVRAQSHGATSRRLGDEQLPTQRGAWPPAPSGQPCERAAVARSNSAALEGSLQGGADGQT